MTDDKKDYYHGKQMPWQDDWFEMFKNGEWINNKSKDSSVKIMPQEFDSYHPYCCNVCKRGSFQEVSLQQCSGCKIFKYCCRDHQRQDWKFHKPWCKAFATDLDQNGSETTDRDTWNKRHVEIMQTLMMKMKGDVRHSNEVQVPHLRPHCRRC